MAQVGSKDGTYVERSELVDAVNVVIADRYDELVAEAEVVLDGDPAGGVLDGTYPSPTFAEDMATQAELDSKFDGDILEEASLPSSVASVSDETAQSASRFAATEIVPGTFTDANYNAFQTLLQFPSGKLVEIFRQASAHIGAGVYGKIVKRVSTDQGATYSNPAEILSEASVDLRTSCCGCVTPTGRGVLFYTRYDPDTPRWLSINYIYTDDEAVTWSVPAEIDVGSMTTFMAHGPMIAAGDGKLLQGWYGDDGTTYKSYVIVTADDGETWGAAVEVLSSRAQRFTEASYAYLAGGFILGLVRDDIGTAFREVVSTDNAATWDDLGDTEFDTWSTPSPPTLATFLSAPGRVAVACYYANRTDKKFRVVYATAKGVYESSDAGDTWGSPSDLADIGTDSGYAGVIHPLAGRRAYGCFYDNGSLKYFAVTAPALSPSASATKSGNQSIPNNAFTTVSFTGGVQEFDTDEMFSTSANVFTCKTPGIYTVAGSIFFATNATGDRAIAIVKNGSTIIAEDVKLATALGDTPVLNVATIAQLEVGDTLELQAYQNSGDALNIGATGSAAPRLAVHGG